ncbi:MAG: ribosome-recycling factor [Microgenomates group bacterium]|jgi:ribosome recycling factor
MDIVTQFKQSAQKTIAALKEELKSIRTGRATPALVENLQITTYNGTTTLKLKEIASISTEGPQTLVIAPYDATTVGDIEKGILSSAMGLTPASQGTRILVKIPPLSQEQREKFIKICGQFVEEKRVSIRGQRDENRRKIKAQFEQKTITEDAKFRLEKDIDTASSDIMDEVDAIKDSKEKEIREI